MLEGWVTCLQTRGQKLGLLLITEPGCSGFRCGKKLRFDTVAIADVFEMIKKGLNNAGLTDEGDPLAGGKVVV